MKKAYIIPENSIFDFKSHLCDDPIGDPEGTSAQMGDGENIKPGRRMGGLGSGTF